MEIICVDGKFSADFLDFYTKNGVSVPLEGNIYNPRNVNKNSNGDYEILLVEIVNPEVKIQHKILGAVYKEPAWKLSRFAKIDGSQISLEEIASLKNELKLVEYSSCLNN